MPKIDERTHDQLREAIRSGDRSISAEMLAAAEHRVEHERLLAEAAELAAERAAEEEHAAKLAELRADIEASTVDVDRMRERAETATRALVELAELAKGRAATLAELAARAKGLGCPNGSGLNLADGEIGYRRFDSGSHMIMIGSRTLSSPGEYELLDRVAADARGRAGLKAVKPGVVNKVAPPSLEDQLAVTDRTPPPPPPPVAIRWLSGVKRGTVESVDPGHARHWVSRRMAEFVT